MYLPVITILGAVCLVLLPAKTFGTTEVQETPQALPLIAQTQPTTGVVGINSGNSKIGGVSSSSSLTSSVGEIWQEDDHEVLIRNERGTKQNNGNGGTSSLGKRGKSKKNKNPINNNNNSSMKISHEHKLQSKNLEQSQEQQHHNNSNNHNKQQQNQLKQSHHQQQQHKQSSNHGKNLNKNIESANEERPKAISPACRYVKSPWTECDPKTNMRTRTLTLKKGDGCDLTRTIEKKCKKACRYEKGTWSECTAGQISRTDKLKSTSDSTCNATRVINKNCNTGKSKDKMSNKERKNKEKGARKGRA